MIVAAGSEAIEKLVFAGLIAIGLITLGVTAVRFAWSAVGRWFPPQEPPRLRAEITLAFEVTLVFVAAAVLSSMLLSPDPERPSVARSVLVMLLANVLTLGYILLAIRSRGGRITDLGFTRVAWKRGLAYAATLYLAFLPVVMGTQIALEAMSQAVLGHELATQRVVEELGANTELRQNLPVLIAITLVVPFCEEFLFRGFLYTLLRRHLSAAMAIAIDAVIFGVVHDAGISAVMLLGGLLAFVFERTRSVWACALAHSMHNTGTVLIILLQGSSS